jgi:hypothetical protein
MSRVSTLRAVAGIVFNATSLVTFAACRQPATETGKPATAAVSQGTSPASLAMGGAKSVTRFFVTSKGPGRGGDLGGLAGADAHCQALAKAEGSGDHTWRAYLSTTATNIGPAINARDRIGQGPWYNALGDRIAANLDELHAGTAITSENALTERGDPVSMAGILTGSHSDGTAFVGSDDLTCGSWTSTTGGQVQVGRLDPAEGGRQAPGSWNSAHSVRGCSQRDLEAAGGSGQFYCFAIDER